MTRLLAPLKDRIKARNERLNALAQAAADQWMAPFRTPVLEAGVHPYAPKGTREAGGLTATESSRP